jgi:transposase
MIMVLNLTMKEAERYKVISEVEEGYLKVKEAGGILGLSERQVYRMKARVKKEGAGGLIHRSKGKKTPLWLTDKIRGKIDHLYKTQYRGFNLTHMTVRLRSLSLSLSKGRSF